MPTATLTTQVERTSTSFVDNTRAFKRIYRASRQAWHSDENPLASYFDISPDGHKTRGRRFGIEIEFDNPSDPVEEPYCDCYCDCSQDSDCNGYDCNDNHTCFDVQETRVGSWLYNEGLTILSGAEHYHASAGAYHRWRYECDETVTGGEVITPIMDDSAVSWETIQRVMKAIMLRGGEVNEESVGGHISIEVPELPANREMLTNLMFFATKFEDVMYRLAANPMNGDTNNRISRHRGTSYAIDIASQVMRGNTDYVMTGGGWMSHRGGSRLEFRIFDGSLSAEVSQTFTLIAAAICDFAGRDDALDTLSDFPDRPLGWHVIQRREAGFQARTSLSGEAWEKDTLAIREFVDLLFDNDQDKERVVTLFAGNDWNR